MYSVRVGSQYDTTPTQEQKSFLFLCQMQYPPQRLCLRYVVNPPLQWMHTNNRYMCILDY